MNRQPVPVLPPPIQNPLTNIIMRWTPGTLKCLSDTDSEPIHHPIPTVFVYLINNALSLSTRFFCGHLGNLELAAASVGNSGLQLLGLMMQSLYVVHLLYVDHVDTNKKGVSSLQGQPLLGLRAPRH
ncbi:protein TRANSPARENT TESTA 12 [Corchorus capsularis]|uniref:Protein TRANSPARENT TESTA 12 n=1 Tax=Corchorus capsularis TaxID=210143 RepID=A0A1R3GXA6_COCAP|nr:protein TRANSPARENT TESTA 12 [Corchorus capsularis]